MSTLDAAQVRRRFLVLRALRWLPTGLLIPVLVLLLLARGLDLGDVGLLMAVQGVVVMALELPTGGLADAHGRRPVLVAAAAIEAVATGLLVVAGTLPLLVAVFVLQGVYRALESGPLDAWYVDASQAADAEADVGSGLAAGGVALGLAVAAGTLASGGLVALGPVAGIDALALPLVAAVVLRVVELGAVWRLLAEVRPPAGRGALRRSVVEVPAVLGQARRLITGDRTLLALLAVELLWGLGMVAFETFTPPRLETVTGSAEQAAALMGPASAAAWLVSAGGAAAVPALTRRVGAAVAGAWMRVAQGLTTAGIALAAGSVGVIGAFLLTMALHGAANPVHQAILHRSVEGPTHRATVVSANSLTAMGGGAVGGVALGALADASTLPLAILVGAVALALPAPLYLTTRRGPGGRTS